MASPILHIKDSYYFEVPKSFWSKYKTLKSVPPFLRDGHPDATLEEYNDALAGKVLIPQPFGKLQNLYEKKSGFAISKYMIIEVAVALLLVLVFSRLAAKMKKGLAPTGSWWNLLEAMVYFIRDQIAKPAIGEHDANRFVPLLWTMFFFVLFCNLAGMIPLIGAPTGSFSVTLALAGVTLLTVVVCGIAKFGPIGFWLNQVPHMDLPWWMQPLKVGIFLIEVLGLVIKHAVLAIRLLANMMAGHLVLFAVLALAFGAEAAHASTTSWSFTAVVAILGSVALSLLELFVAFLQAYVFTFLSALFIGAAVHHH